jgi:hypothetical protein
VEIIGWNFCANALFSARFRVLSSAAMVTAAQTVQVVSVGTNPELVITPANCGVESSLTINGDPNVTIATQINFANNAVLFPVALREKGGISYGPHPSGSCTLDVTYTVNSPTSCTVTGTLCGQKLGGSC